MFNKIYEWIGTGFANLRNGVPAADHPETHGVQQGGQIKRKRSIECLEDGEALDQEDLAVKKSRLGDLVDTVKIAAGGVKSHSTNVASWVTDNVKPTLRNILPSSPDPPPVETQLEVSSSASNQAITQTDGEVFVRKSDLADKFASPSTTQEWKTSKSGSFRIERTMMGSKVCRRQVCMGLAQREAPKTNGHSVSLLASRTPIACPAPRLGRSLNLRPHGTGLCSPPGVGAASGSFTSMYEKTFPIRVMQSPTHSSSTNRPARACCTAQESVREEEKEVYRQLLTMVSGGQSSFLHNGSSHSIVRSHRDFNSFLSCPLRKLSSPTGSGTAEPSDGPSEPPSPQVISSQSSSNLPSPAASSLQGNQAWAPKSDLSPRGAASQRSVPSPGALQDSTSQDTQSSAHDGDSVIIVKEKKGTRADTSVPCFQAELWIKELTSMYDSRARERRRQIEEKEALASLLLRQRLSGEYLFEGGDVEVHVRVPLEKEVPLAELIEEPKTLDERPEFPDLTETMENEVNRAFRGGSPDEVLSEGFRLTITRKDLQTLSHLNWLNDEVINFYMNLLVERSKEAKLPSVHTFNTFFFPKLRSAGYSTVRRWTKKMDIFSVDILLVPVHLGVHWCLSVVDIRKKSITYFDSMGGNNDEACGILLQYLQQESKDKKGKELDTSDWTLKSKRRNEIPQQMNGSDCGMFTCKYAEYITKDKPITFTQKHMPYFRKRMVWEIIHQKLL